VRARAQDKSSWCSCSQLQQLPDQSHQPHTPIHPTHPSNPTAEWVLLDAAAHAFSMTSVPLYDTLGPDAVE